MRTMLIALCAVLGAGAAEAAPASALGVWTVTKVETDPSMPVTAVAPGDPAYLGAKLTIGASQITWSKGASNGSGTFDDCAAPRFAAGASGVAVTCGGAPWGPDAALTPLSENRLRLGWYDGGVLTLTRD